MLEWALDRLPDEVDHVVVAVNWLADKLEEHFEQSDRDLRFTVVRESEPLGTAGAVKNCEEHLRSDAFFVINGDIVSSMDLGAMLAQHRETNAVGTIALKEVAPEEVVNYGVAKMAEDDPRRIEGFVEKPPRPEDAPSRLINAGAYLLDRAILEIIEPDRLVSMEKEIFPLLLAQGFYGSAFDGTWIDVGDPVRLLQASQAMGHDAYTGTETSVEHGAHLVDTMVGDRCHIGAGARLMDCVIGDDVSIDQGVTLQRCIVGDGEHVNHDAVDARIWSHPVPEGYPEKQVGNAIPGKA